MFVLPMCRHCGRRWGPPKGVCATETFCPNCSGDRRKIAKRKLKMKPIQKRDVVGGYVLPRSFKAKRAASN
jgi:hypothetical protein